jgi:hypothetical protein
MSPLLETFANASIRGYFALSTKTPTYFIASLASGGSYTWAPQSVTADIDGNVWGTVGAGADAGVYRIAPDGTLFTYNALRSSGNSSYNQLKGIFGAPGGGVVAGGFRGGSTSYSQMTVKFSSPMSINWNYLHSSYTYSEAYAVAIAADGTIYYGGQGNNVGFLTKTTSSGTSPTAVLQGVSGTERIQVLAVAPNGNIATGIDTTSPSALYTVVNSSLTKQWGRALSGGQNSFTGGIGFDASSNLIITYSWFSGNYRAFVVSLNSSTGATNWQKQLAFSGTNVSPSRAGTDADGNFYSTFVRDNSSLYYYLVKYNSSGTLLWQRRISITGKNITGGAGLVAIDSNKNIVLSFQYNGTYAETMTMRVPNDGTLTGSYTVGSYTVVYESTTDLVETTPTITNNAGGYNNAASSITNVDSAWSNQSSSSTIAYKKIP